MKHRFFLCSPEGKGHQTSANRGRSAFVLQSDEVRRRKEDGPPKLPIRLVTVRPRNGALVYTDEGNQIPEEQWSQVPISPGLVMALKYGDLEEAEEVPAGSSEGNGERDRKSGSAAEEKRARRESNTSENTAR